MNPAALKTNLKDLVDERHADRQHRRVHRGEPQEGRLRDEPARGRLARQVQGPRGRHHPPDDGRARRQRAVEQGEGPREELLRARPRVLDVRPRARERDPPHPPAVREEAGVRRGERQGVQGRLPLRRDRRGVPDGLQGAAGDVPPGMYRNITGNEAIALGLVVGAELAGKKLFYSGYPITPASSILHSLAKYKNFGTLTFQAEDEIAAMGAAIGAAYGGAIAVTASSGPGHRAQGRSDRPRRDDRAAGRDPQRPARRPVDRPADEDRAVAISTRRCTAATASRRSRCSRRSRPGDTFYCAIEAVKIATRYMVPVMLLSDGYIANGSRAVAAAEPRGAAAVRRHPPHRSERLLRVRARSAHARARLGHPRHAGPRAPHRRHREGRADRQHLVRAGEPREADEDPRREGRARRAGHRRARSRRRRVAATCS